MRKEREALKSGVCHMEGRTLSEHNQDPKLDKDGPVTVFYAFDGPAKLRYDRTYPGWVMVPGSAVPDPDHPGMILRSEQERGITGQKYCTNSKRRACWWDIHSGQLGIDAKAHERPPDAFGWWDIRAVGLFSNKMTIPGAYDLEKILDVFADFDVKYGQMRAIDKTDPNRRVASLSCENGETTAEQHLSVDVNRGFTPVEYLDRWRHDKSQPWVILARIKVSWEKKNAVWVPTHYELESSPHHRMWYDLHWENVNKPVDEKLFDYHDFGAPAWVNIVDLSLGQPVLLQAGRQSR
jgi:hypothetical protein